ncbi:ImmA/IrrE family metallo-endopeptidase [Paenibacillus yanchengensis]|uniref:ImmA/IrrE family metallo-endopeptidase n=1 Tax=Paenibacillus yanchengensis TaxID=2035833 RepID=A0ABW4YLB7_9BACL
MAIDMNLYRPAHLELKIEQCYKQHGIHTPDDLTIDNVSAAFNIELGYYDGKPFADWDDDIGIVVLNQQDPYIQQKVIFYHEAAHCVLHAGDQHQMHELFKNLQEAQSARFQYYAAIPYYMIPNVIYGSYDDYVLCLVDIFQLPYSFVRKRVVQILNRIQQEQQDRDYINQTKPKPATYEYSSETKRILNQLHQQVAERNAPYHVQH